MRPLAAVLIARYLAATGRRDAAIATLTDRSEPWHELETVIGELDVLDAVDALGMLAGDPKLTRRDAFHVARALARRRRIDLLRPLFARRLGQYGSLAGLWAAAADADDSLLVRDWILPHADPGERCACARFLALVGDVAMARAIVDELRAALPPAQDTGRIVALTDLAPAVAACGDLPTAEAMVDEAQAVWDAIFDENVDGYGDYLADAIDGARALTAHVTRLARERTLPWYTVQQVSHVFTGFIRRGGPNRAQQERWAHAIAYAIDARDAAALLATFEHARATDTAHAPYLLGDLAERLPRAWIDHDLAMALSTAAVAITDSRQQDGGVAVIGALAEAGHLAAAAALLPHVATIYTSPNVYARLAAHARDRVQQRAWLDLALTGTGNELALAQFVDADLRARR